MHPLSLQISSRAKLELQTECFVCSDRQFRFNHPGEHISLAGWAAPKPCQQLHSFCLSNICIFSLDVVPSLAFKKVLRSCIGGSGKHALTYRVSVLISTACDKP